LKKSNFISKTILTCRWPYEEEEVEEGDEKEEIVIDGDVVVLDP
jgi:hypothetical protein